MATAKVSLDADLAFGRAHYLEVSNHIFPLIFEQPRLRPVWQILRKGDPSGIFVGQVVEEVALHAACLPLPHSVCNGSKADISALIKMLSYNHACVLVA